MNSFLRVGLPILVVIGLVFGITFVRLYTGSDETKEAGAIDATGKPLTFGTDSALHFFTVKAAVPPAAALARPDGAQFLHLKYWPPEVEIGASAGYGFWCENKHPQAVRLRTESVGCQCTGLAAAPVPPATFREYLLTSALAGSPLCPAPGPVALLAQVELLSKLEWTTLLKDGDRNGLTIPAADPTTGPQLALVRMFWSGKDPVGPKNNIYASMYAGLPNTVETKTGLSADVVVVQAFDLVRRDGPKWVPVVELAVGELKRNAVARQSFYCFSTTRPALVVSAALDVADPCVSVAGPFPAAPEEVAEFEAFMAADAKSKREIRSMYRFDLVVRERLETEVDGKRESRLLDLGPLDRKLSVKTVGAGGAILPVKGLAVGEVTILSGATEGRIDLGSSFSAAQDRSVEVILSAERPDADLTLVAAETATKVLKVELTPLPSVGGKKQWKLRVTVPKGTLYTAVPEGTAVVLTTAGPTARKIRLPVRGGAFDSGPAL